MKKNVVVYSDPGHGWAAVPVKELIKMGVAHRISGYSYRKAPSDPNGLAHLEEDCDLSVYLEALWARGIEPVLYDRSAERHSKIRSYHKFVLSPEERVASVEASIAASAAALADAASAAAAAAGARAAAAFNAIKE